MRKGGSCQLSVLPTPGRVKVLYQGTFPIVMEWRERLCGPRLLRCGATGPPLATALALRPAPLLGLYFPWTGGEQFTAGLHALHAALPGGLEVVQVAWTSLSASVQGEGPDPEAFLTDIETLPWCAVPLEDVETRTRLIRQHRVKAGAPTLVLLGPAGELSRPSLDQLLQPEGFPWRPRTIPQILEGVVLERCSDLEPQPSLTYSDLPETTVKAFYFAAHWCPPCKSLTPQLAETFSLVRRRGHDFHLIYVSSDRSEESYRLVTGGMPWLSVPWACSAARTELAGALGVLGIPALLVLAPGAPPVDARPWAAGDPEGLNFPWKPAPVTILCQYSLDRLGDHPAIVLFVENDEEEIRWAESVLQPAATSLFQQPGGVEGVEGELTFLVAPDGEASEALREAAGLGAALPLLVAVDLPHGRRYDMALGQPLDATAASQFVEAFHTGTLPSVTLEDQ